MLARSNPMPGWFQKTASTEVDLASGQKRLTNEGENLFFKKPAETRQFAKVSFWSETVFTAEANKA